MASNSQNGAVVCQFEDAFASYVGAKYAIAMCNGTATLHAALVALGVKPGDRVAVPPLTMASTTLAVLHAGAVPLFWDVDPKMWIVDKFALFTELLRWAIPVSLYGLGGPVLTSGAIDDAAQTLNKHRGMAFTSYSFQASKILSAGEGGILVTDDADLALRAKEFSRLGYVQLDNFDGWVRTPSVADLKHPDAVRHVAVGWNYRMADCQAALLLLQLKRADELLVARRYSADCYRQVISGCDWITPQYVPEGWPHSYWTYAVALKDKTLWEPLAQAIVKAGGERPYAAWRITYQEPAFRHLAPDGTCPVAEDLQPRLMQLQTNHSKAEAARAADVLHEATKEIGG